MDRLLFLQNDVFTSIRSHTRPLKITNEDKSYYRELAVTYPTIYVNYVLEYREMYAEPRITVCIKFTDSLSDGYTDWELVGQIWSCIIVT